MKYLLLCLGLIGCGYDPLPCPGKISIRDEVPDHWRQATIKAIDAWNQAMGAEVITVADSGFDLRIGPEIRTNNKWELYQLRELYITVPEGEYEDMTVIMMHELGHFLGLDHVESDSVMVPSAKDLPEGITEKDIKYLASICGI